MKERDVLPVWSLFRRECVGQTEGYGDMEALLELKGVSRNFAVRRGTPSASALGAAGAGWGGEISERALVISTK